MIERGTKQTTFIDFNNMKEKLYRDYSPRLLVALAVTLLAIGFTSVFVTLKILTDPDRPEVQKARFESSLEINLCEFIKDDLKKFKKSPLNFARSDLETLIAEATVIARMQAKASTEPHVYSKTKTDYLSRCKEEARKWIEIKSVAQHKVPEEREYLLTGKEPDGGKSLSAQQPDTAVSANPKTTTHARTRALVIGNFDYRERPLANPGNDAKQIAKKLRELGFEVDLILNTKTGELQSVTERFLKTMANYDLNLFFYSGHGSEISGRNYLIPTDAEIRRIGELARQGTDLSKIITDAEKYQNSVKIFIIDACRTLPILADTRDYSGGLKEIKLKNASGMLVAFATAPGTGALDGTGRLSPYTHALLTQLDSGAQDIETMMKKVSADVQRSTNGRQVPWYSSSLTGEIKILGKQVPSK